MRNVHELDVPPSLPGEARVHLEELAGEQRRLFAADAGADFHDDAAGAGGVAGKGELLEDRQELVLTVREGRDLGFRLGLHVGVREQGLRLGLLLLDALEVLVGLDGLQELPALLHQCRVLGRLGGDGGVLDQLLDLVEACGLLFDLIEHRLSNGKRFRPG